MATYKLIQDIEAEDKILGPLTLRQFIFAMVAVFLFYICFVLFVKHLVFLLVIFLPPALFCGFFALPFGRDQPTEVWALAKLRFWFKPRRRVWNQSGIKEMVTITAPKKVERVLTNGLSQTEVSSRLQVLAQTLDSRGWAVKHVASDIYVPAIMDSTSDRLISFDSLPQEVPGNDPAAGEDMLDENTSPIARQFDSMITQSTQTRRQELMNQLNDVRVSQAAPALAGAPDMWFMNRRAVTATPAAVAPVVNSATSDEQGLSARLAAQTNSRQVSFGNLRTVQPLAPQTAAPAAVPVPKTTASDNAILSLARNDDLNVATLARQANKNEVVIPLH